MIATEMKAEDTLGTDDFRTLRAGYVAQLKKHEEICAALRDLLGLDAPAAEPAKRKPGRPRGSKSKATEVTA